MCVARTLVYSLCFEGLLLTVQVGMPHAVCGSGESGSRWTKAVVVHGSQAWNWQRQTNAAAKRRGESSRSTPRCMMSQEQHTHIGVSKSKCCWSNRVSLVFVLAKRNKPCEVYIGDITWAHFFVDTFLSSALTSSTLADWV